MSAIKLHRLIHIYNPSSILDCLFFSFLFVAGLLGLKTSIYYTIGNERVAWSRGLGCKLLVLSICISSVSVSVYIHAYVRFPIQVLGTVLCLSVYVMLLSCSSRAMVESRACMAASMWASCLCIAVVSLCSLCPVATACAHLDGSIRAFIHAGCC